MASGSVSRNDRGDRGFSETKPPIHTDQNLIDALLDLFGEAAAAAVNEEQLFAAEAHVIIFDPYGPIWGKHPLQTDAGIPTGPRDISRRARRNSVKKEIVTFIDPG